MEKAFGETNLEMSGENSCVPEREREREREGEGDMFQTLYLKTFLQSIVQQTTLSQNLLSLSFSQPLKPLHTHSLSITHTHF